jgi:hypothetical protein
VGLLGRLAGFAAVLSLAACAADVGDEATDGNEDAVIVDTSSPAARAQYDANVTFLRSYVPRCKPSTSKRPRVIVTGFGRFLSTNDNATGHIVNTLVPAARYPSTTAPAPGKVDLPGPQTSVAVSTIHLPNAGDVDVCAMVVPVYWDLAAILVAKEIDAFRPNLVLMNGVADQEQDLWLELGAVNRAMTEVDGSDMLTPVAPPGQTSAKIVSSATKQDDRRGLLLSWNTVEDAARAAIASRAGHLDEDGRRFGDVLTGASLAGFPRSGNTYLCNNITYAVDYLMAYPGKSITLLKASKPVAGRTNQVSVSIHADVRAVPRVFMHWPSTLTGSHLGDAAQVLASVIDAQLTAKDPATRGSNGLAEIVSTGDTF